MKVSISSHTLSSKSNPKKVAYYRVQKIYTQIDTFTLSLIILIM